MSLPTPGVDAYQLTTLAAHADAGPDAAVGTGAVAKLVANGYGTITMKVAKGTSDAPAQLVEKLGEEAAS
jgi:hypothetical protein